MEDWVSIRNIRTKNPKLGTRKIAKLLGISRNTIKKALDSEDAPKYKSTTTAINEHVLPFEKFIKEAFLTKKLKASRILKDIISKGYKGSCPSEATTPQGKARGQICTLCIYS